MKRAACLLVLIVCLLELHAQGVFDILKRNDAKGLKEYIGTKKSLTTPDQNGLTPMMFAAANCDKEIVELLVAARPADVNFQRSSDRTTPLMCAAGWGRSEVVEYLLEKGADIDVSTTDGYTAFRLAVDHRRTDNIEVLIRHKPDYSIVDRLFGYTALGSVSYAAKDLEIMKLLAANGCGLNDRGSQKERPIDIAVLNNNLEGVRALIDAGAELDGPMGNGSITVLKFVRIAKNGMNYKEIEKLLVSRGAKE